MVALLGLTVLGTLVPTAMAHPPSSVIVEYLPAAQQLNVSITHVVFDPGAHYVYKVEVRRNDVLNITAQYSSQPTSNVFNYTYNISAVDGDVLSVTAYCSVAGQNTGFVTVSVAPPPDTIIPIIKIVNPAPLQTFNHSSIVVNGTASDNVAVARVEVSLNNGTWQPAAGTADWSTTVTLALGPNFIRARATDTSDNTGLDVVYVTLINQTGPPPDTAPPAISITVPHESETVNTDHVHVFGTASDSGGVRVVELRANNGTWSPAEGNESWNGIVNLVLGQNLVEARATDHANNTASAFVNVTYMNQTGPPPDTTPPSVAIAQPSEGREFNVTGITVSGTASDDAGLAVVDVRVGGGAWKAAQGTTAWSAAVTLVNGTNRIDARATDTSGNAATATVNVTFRAPPPPPPPPPDTTPPSITILSPEDGSISTSAGMTVNGTASDNVGVSRVEVRNNGGTWALAAGNTSWTTSLTLAEGKNAIEARATDPSGNVGFANVSATYARPGSATLDGVISEGEYSFCRTFGDGAFQLFWRVRDDSMSMAMTGQTEGWVAIGLQPTQMMKDADMIVGWVDGSGKPGIMDCYSPELTASHPPDTSFVPPGTNDIREFGASESGGSTTVEFTRLLRTGDDRDREIPANGTLNFIWALGPNDDFNSKHIRVGYATVNITTGASTERASMNWRPHAALMGAGLGLLLIGMFVARMKKRRWWLKGHRALGISGAALAVLGLVYGFYMIQVSTEVHIRVLHAYVGLGTLVLTMAMPVAGQSVARLARNHPWIRPAHRWLGRITLVMLLATVVLGLVQAGIILV